MEILLTESARQILVQGVLGSLLVVGAISGFFLVRFLYKECNTERVARREEMEKFVALTQKMIVYMESANQQAERRTQIVQGLSENIARQAEAFSAITKLHELQFARLFDRIKGG